VAEAGGLHILVNNAGIAGPTDEIGELPLFWETEPAEWSRWLATNLYGVNDILAFCGETAKAMARSNQFGLVDFNGPFTALNLEVQKTNAEATLVGRDRVHPGDLGHLLLAYLFLKAQGQTATVATVEIDARAKRVAREENCAVSGLAFPDGGVAYEYAAAALPFPVTGAYASADALVPWTEGLNAEIVRVTGLDAGNYALSMDDAALGSYSAAQLARGVNVATNQASPAQGQAQAVHKTNWDRGNQERTLRGLGQVEMGMRRANVDPADPAAAIRYCQSNLDRFREQPDLPNAAYYRSVYSNYLLSKPKQAEVSQRAEELLEVLYRINKPRAHRIVIRRP
jgi:NAD(P)-dependent dehydrogenase (short-subunit alcohol dehydrogenase family)